jgi:predicted SAM-dependent methyltransferase
MNPRAAERARMIYDEVITDAAESALAQIDGPFDTILCYDVLEHLVDPPALLRSLHSVATPNARLHVSVPNARHYSLLYDLALRGTFGYRERGHRDSTHLRWFTRGDIMGVLEAARWTVEVVSHGQLAPRSRFVIGLTRGLVIEFLVVQWWLLARSSHR